MHRITAARLAAALIAVGALAGCGGQGPGPSPSPSASATRADGSLPFGGSAVYGTDPKAAPDPEHALRVSVVAAGVMQAPPSAETKGHHAGYRRFRVVLQNTTDRTWQLRQIRVVGMDGDEVADHVVDRAEGVGVQPQGDLPPGRTVTWDVAFSDDEGFPAVRVIPRNERGTFRASVFSP